MSLSVGFKAAKSKTGFMAYKDLKPQYHQRNNYQVVECY